MVKIDQSFMQRAARRDVEHSQTNRSQHSPQNQAVKGVEQDDFQPGVKQGFTVFYRKIMAAMEKSLQRPYEPVEQALNETQLEGAEKRANQAASNILGFIEKQFQVDKAAGRSQEQLNSRYEAAIKGFEQGYKEAEDILGSLSLLSPELEEEITQTKDLVLEGLAELKRTLIEGTETDSSEATEKAGGSRWVGGIEQAQANEFSFELTTNDGDKVTIYASAASLNRVEGGYQQTGGGNGSGNANNGFGYLESISINQQQFQLQIDGDLDEDELKAIYDLLNNVSDLANDFYSGDVNTAFDKASALGYDTEEISQFSINLTQVKHVQAYQAYQGHNPLLASPGKNEFAPLAEFAKQVQQSLADIGELFTQPGQLFKHLAQPIDAIYKPSDWTEQYADFNQFSGALVDKLLPQEAGL